MKRAAALGFLGLLGACGPGPSSPDAGPSCPNDFPTACPATPPSYMNEIAGIVQNRCLSCHGPGGVSASTPLTTYTEVYNLRRDVMTQVYGCKMPQPGAPQLTTEERQALLKWLLCGAPEN